MYSLILSKQKRVVPAFVVAVLISAAFIFGIIFNAKGATFNITSPSGGTCYVYGTSIPISWTASTLPGVNHYAVYYTTNDGSTKTLIPGGHPVTGNSISWTPETSVIGFPIKIVIDGHDSAHTTLESAMSSTSFGVSTSCGGGSSAPPVPGTIAGAPSGTVGTSYNFSVILYSDPDGQQVQAVFDWGDGSSFGYSTFITPSGGGTSTTPIGHVWNTSGTYYVKAKAKDSGGAESGWTSTWAITISGATGCSSVPPAPSSLTATPSSSQVALSWPVVTCADKYNIYRRSPASTGTWSYVLQVTTTSHSDSSSISSGSSYDYKVESCLSGYGCSGNSDNYAYAYNVLIPGGTDTTAPTAPTGLTATPYSVSRIDLSWNASTDNVGVTNYKIFRNSAFWYQTSALSYADTGLTSNTTYSYYIKAVDAAGNESTASATASAVTPSGTASCTGLSLTFANNDTSYVIGDMVTYTYICIPGGTAPNVTVQVVSPGGTATTYNTATNVSQNTLGFSTSNLSAGDYTLRACFTSSCSPVTVSAVFSVVSGTTGDNTAPVISNLGEQDIIGMGAKVKWLTDDPSDSFVEYGTSFGNYTNNSSSYCYGSGLVTDHCLYLTNLTLNTTYFYRVRSVNAAGLQIQATGDFQSASGTDTSGVPPTPTNFRLEPAPVSSPTPTIYLKWNVSTDADKYNLSRSQHGLNNWTYFPQLMGNTNTSYADSSVGVSVYYDYRVEACHSGYGCSTSSAYLTNVSVGGTSTTTTQNGSVSGTVKTSSGVAVAGANINIRSSDNVYNFYTTAASDGTYHFNNLFPYSYILTAYPPSNRTDLSPSSAQSVSIAADQNTVRDLQLISGTKILTGKVLRNDGRAVTYAEVGAWRADGQPGGGMAATDSNGNYSITLSGGKWNVSVHPSSASVSSADWFYNSEPTLIEFIADSTTENKSVNFTVASQSSFIIGSVRYPDGSIPPASLSSVGFFNSTTRIGAVSSIAADGTFKVAIAAGTYQVDVYITDPTLYAPILGSVSVSDGQTKDLGIITLKKKSELIRGRVYGPNGEGVGGAEVKGYLSGTTNSIVALTKSDGSYELNVTAGTWNIGLNPNTLGGYAYNGAARSIAVAAGSTVSSVDFALSKAGSVLSGNVVDASGQIITGFYGHVGVMPQDGFGTSTQGYYGYAEFGAFTIALPPGNYNVQVYPAYGSNYSPSASVPVTVLSGTTAKVLVKINAGNSIIQGTIRNSAGSPISGVKMKVFVSNNKGVWNETDVNTTSGTYKLSLFADSWQLGLRVDGSGYIPGSLLSVNLISGQTLTQDIAVSAASSTIIGKITSPLGAGVANVQVSADYNSFSQPLTTSSFINSFRATTDASGNYKIALLPGTYYLHTYVSSGGEFIGSEEKTVMVVAGETKTVDLVLRSPNLTISGKVFEGGQGRPAFVWAWGESGGGFSTTASSDGSYVLKLSPGKWKVGASYERDQILFKASEIAIELFSGENKSLDIFLIDSRIFLSAPIVKTGTTSTDQVVTNETGVSINIPSNSIAVTGSVTVTLSSSTDAPSQGTANVIGVAYEVEVKDENGQAVTTLNVPATVSIPYNETLISAGEEAFLDLAFWDEALGAWQDVTSTVVDTNNNIITGSVTHLTRFAIVRPADITPPASPSTVRAQVSADKITFSWINPSADFHSAKVYRSTVAGEKGSKVAENITLANWSDSSVQNGTKYYYNIKSVDLAGNESTSLAQTAVIAGEISSSQTVGPYPSGTLFKVGSNPTVWYVDNGKRRGIPSLGVFESRFDWKNVKNITDATHTELYTEDSAIGYPDGLLIKGSAPTVYIIADGKKLPVTTAEAFNALGYKWENIRTVNDSELSLHSTGASLSTAVSYPSGSLIQKEGDPTVWFVDNGVRRGIPTLDVFNIRKLDFKRVIKVLSSVLESIQIGNALAYPDYTLIKGSAPEVYFVEGGKKRHITSGEIFNTNQFDWAAIRNVPDSVLNLMVTGSNLE